MKLHWWYDRDKLKPVSIQEFISTLDFKDRELAKKVIKVYEDWKTYNERYICAFCDKKLMIEDVQAITPDTYSLTCKEHRHLSGVFQVDIERIKLGLIERKYLEV